jgi:predicted ATP-grasp superfamily ATP-dependent carboligase
MWLRKPWRGGGGRGVRRWKGGQLRRTEILQRHIRGLSCSAVAIGDGRSAAVLGLTEQLHRGPGFQWTGNVAPPPLPEAELEELDGQLRAVCTEVAARFGVRGAFGVDAIWDGRHAWVLEVNPRPPAGLELFGPGCFEAHVRGARGLGLPAAGAPPATRCARVKLVLFAHRDLRAPDPRWWPAGLVRDVPHAGEAIKRGAPVCTLISTTGEAQGLAARGARLLAAIPDAVLAHG